MTYDELKIGKIYYTVTNTTNGPVVKKLLLKDKTVSYVFLIDQSNNTTQKLYSYQIQDLLTKEDAKKVFSKMKKDGPIKPPISTGPFSTGSYSDDKVCWNCHTKIASTRSSKCPRCGWYICPRCGACGCGR